MIFICTFFLLFLCIGFYHYKRDILSPALIQPLIWAFMLGGAGLLEDTFFELPTSTILMYTIGSLLFLGGFWVASGLAPRDGGYGHITIVNPEHTRNFRNALFLLVLFILPLYVRTGYALASTGPVDDFATNLRYSLTEGNDYEEGYGILGYGVTLSMFLVSLEAAYYNSAEKRRLLASTAMAIVFCVLSTGRTYMFLLLLCFFVPLIITGRVQAGKGILALVGIFAVLFFVYSVVLAKDGGGGIDAFIQVVSVYLYGAIFAFAKLTQTMDDYEGGMNLFRTFFAIARKFDASIEVKSIIEEYVFVPLPTNVYTVFGKAYRDFGFAGTGVYMMLIGYLQGHIYSRAKLGSTYYQLAFVFTMFPLLMQFFQDQYLGLLSTWVQWMLLIVLFRHFTRRGAVKYRVG
jgi:oligosaccharide repeat unit polymerase